MRADQLLRVRLAIHKEARRQADSDLPGAITVGTIDGSMLHLSGTFDMDALAEAANYAATADWRMLDTAPTDGTRFDVWLNEGSAEQYRVPDVWIEKGRFVHIGEDGAVIELAGNATHWLCSPLPPR